MMLIRVGVVFCLLWGCLGFGTPFACGDLYSYSFQLQARASIGPGATTFNLPPGSAFSSATPDINNHRNVTFRTLVVGSTGNQGIWYGGVTTGNLGAGEIVYSPGAPADPSLSDPTINNQNIVVFPQTFSSSNGIYRYDPSVGSASLYTNGPLGASSWANPRMNDVGELGTRVTFASGQAYVSYGTPPSQFAVHATDHAADPTSPYSFLSTSNFDNSRRIAGRVNLGTSFNNANPDEVRIFETDGGSMLIAADQDADPGSPFVQFDNTQPGMNDQGWVAFIARTTSAAASRSVFLSNGTDLVTIGTPGTGFSSVDNFSPAVNNLNQVVFRGTDLNGNLAIFVGDGTTLQRIIGIGDLLDTDIGPFAINSLGGNPTINDLGDVAFGGGLGAGGNFIAVAVTPEPSSAVLGLAAILAGVTYLRGNRPLPPFWEYR